MTNYMYCRRNINISIAFQKIVCTVDSACKIRVHVETSSYTIVLFVSLNCTKA